MTEIPFLLHNFLKYRPVFVYFIVLYNMFFSRKIHQKKGREHSMNGVQK